MTDFSHLDAIQGRLAREADRARLATTDAERAFREREVVSAEKELAAEYKFLGITPMSLEDIFAEIGDDELLAELFA